MKKGTLPYDRYSASIFWFLGAPFCFLNFAISLCTRCRILSMSSTDNLSKAVIVFLNLGSLSSKRPPCSFSLRKRKMDFLPMPVILAALVRASSLPKPSSSLKEKIQMLFQSHIIQFLVAFTNIFFVFESDIFSRSYDMFPCCSA